MKILQMIPVFYPAFAYGGTVSAALNISKELVNRGHEVTVFTSDTIDKSTRQTIPYLEYEGIKIHYFRNLSNRMAWNRYIFNPGMIRALQNNIRNFDVVHLHGARNFQNIVAVHYANKSKIPYVLQAHGSLPTETKGLIKKIYDKAWGYKTIEGASSLFALTQTEADQYRRLGGDASKLKIIPNGIDLTQFTHLPLRGTFREKNGLSKNDLILLFLGRINIIKGIDLLVEAYCKLIKEIPNLRLVITGPDDNFLSTINDQLQELQPSVAPIFTGPLYGSDKIEAYVDADVYVLPSRYEAFPNTVLEAWACGVPVIVTDGCAIADIVKNAGLVSRIDADDIKNQIKSILIDDESRKYIGLAGKNLCSERFSITSIVNMMESAYYDINITET